MAVKNSRQHSVQAVSWLLLTALIQIYSDKEIWGKKKTWTQQEEGWKLDAENKHTAEKASVVVKVVHAHEIIKPHILHWSNRKALRVRPVSLRSPVHELQIHLKGESLNLGWDYLL